MSLGGYRDQRHHLSIHDRIQNEESTLASLEFPADAIRLAGVQTLTRMCTQLSKSVGFPPPTPPKNYSDTLLAYSRMATELD